MELQDFVNLIEGQRQKLLSGRGLANKVRQMVEDINYKDHLITEFSKSEDDPS